jgi:hypothetical protein
MVYKVRNLQEGSRPGNWIRYWEDATGLPAGKCHRVDCLDNHPDATDGAHVQLVDANDRSWYIVPLCHRCNCQYGEVFYVTGPLVSATDPKVILP